MSIHFFLSLLPPLFLTSMVCSIIIACLGQCKVLDTLLRCAAVFAWFYISHIALGISGDGKSYTLTNESALTGTYVFVYCLPSLIALIIRAIKRKPAPQSALGISPLRLLTPVSSLLIGIKGTMDRHKEMLLRGLFFGVWIIAVLFLLSLLLPIGSEEGYELWLEACLYTYITFYFLHLLLPEIAGAIARCCRK